MVAAQHTESQVALYLIESLPSPKDGLLSRFFSPSVAHLPQVTNQTCFICSHFYFVLPGILTLHTSVSILLLICCTCKTNANAKKKGLEESVTSKILQKYSIIFDTHFSLSALYVWAISGTSGSSGFGSQRREQIDNNTVEEGKEQFKEDYNEKNRPLPAPTY